MASTTPKAITKTTSGKIMRTDAEKRKILADYEAAPMGEKQLVLDHYKVGASNIAPWRAKFGAKFGATPLVVVKVKSNKPKSEPEAHSEPGDPSPGNLTLTGCVDTSVTPQLDNATRLGDENKSLKTFTLRLVKDLNRVQRENAALIRALAIRHEDS